jgi:hypothetical protein
MLDALDASGLVAPEEVERLRGQANERYQAELSPRETERQQFESLEQPRPNYLYKDPRTGEDRVYPGRPDELPLEYRLQDPNTDEVLNVRSTPADPDYVPRDTAEYVPLPGRGSAHVRALTPVDPGGGGTSPAVKMALDRISRQEAERETRPLPQSPAVTRALRSMK